MTHSIQGSEKITFIVKYNETENHIECKYDPMTKFGKIRQDLFTSSFNSISDMDRFGLEFSVNRNKGNPVHFIESNKSKNENVFELKQMTQINHMDMFSYVDLDICRLSTLKLKSGKEYILNVYDRTQTTTIYVDRLYRIMGSSIIICLSILFNGLFLRPIVWLMHFLLKMYRMITDPHNETKRIRCKNGSVMNNSVYEWMFMGIVCYDMYFGIYELSSYSAFCNIGTVLCLYHITDLFKSYKRLNDSEIMARKKYMVKIMLLEITFMIIQCVVTWSPYLFIYSALNIWVILSDLMTRKNYINLNNNNV